MICILKETLSGVSFFAEADDNSGKKCYNNYRITQ